MYAYGENLLKSLILILGPERYLTTSTLQLNQFSYEQLYIKYTSLSIIIAFFFVFER